jgi:hypothetical protein
VLLADDDQLRGSSREAQLIFFAREKLNAKGRVEKECAARVRGKKNLTFRIDFY